MSTDGEIVRLDPTDKAQLQAVAELHSTLLPSSPIPGLGTDFMTRFYYRTLVEDGLVGCFLYQVGERYVGFLAFTEHPGTFMSEGRRRHLLRLLFVVGLAVLTKPSRVRVLWETVVIGRREGRRPEGRRPAAAPAGVGEVLSFGVLEGFRGGAPGRRISNRLFDATIQHLEERGARRLEWNVEKSNVRGQQFYQSYGARLEESAVAGEHELRGWIDLGGPRTAHGDRLAEEPVT